VCLQQRTGTEGKVEFSRRTAAAPPAKERNPTIVVGVGGKRNKMAEPGIMKRESIAESRIRGGATTGRVAWQDIKLRDVCDQTFFV